MAVVQGKVASASFKLSHYGHVPRLPKEHRLERFVSESRAVATVQVDNARVRVTEWRFEPGTATGWHRHQYDYVVVPLTTGRLAITGASGETLVDLVTGHSYFRSAGVEHDVRNANPFVFSFVEIEIKAVPAGS